MATRDTIVIGASAGGVCDPHPLSGEASTQNCRYSDQALSPDEGRFDGGSIFHDRKT